MNDSVNLANLREMTGGDVEMEKELFEVFISSSEEAIASLSANILPETSETWRKQAHALKGISLSLGAEKLGDLCKKAQECFQNTAETKAKMVADIKKEYERVKSYLKEL